LGRGVPEDRGHGEEKTNTLSNSGVCWGLEGAKKKRRLSRRTEQVAALAIGRMWGSVKAEKNLARKREWRATRKQGHTWCPP